MMKNFITYNQKELQSIITTLGFNLHNIAERLYYFQQYAKLYNCEHDFIIDHGIEKLNNSLKILRNEFNINFEDNICLKDISEKDKENTIEKVNKDHSHLI